MGENRVLIFGLFVATLVASTGCGGGGAPPECGDGVLEGDEVCDDGNVDDGDGCNATCEPETGWMCDEESPSECNAICGDGMVLGDEACDDGDDNSDTDPDACRTTCAVAGCGDSVIDTGEVCDDGNTDDVDECSADCAEEACVVGSTHDTIQLAVDDEACDRIAVPAGTYTENVTVDRDVTIFGAGSSSIVDGDDAGHAFGIDSGTVVLEGLQLTNGSEEQGGGLNNDGADVTLQGVLVTGNSAESGGGIYSDGGTVTLIGSDVVSNDARLGGGLYGSSATILIEESSAVDSNTVTSDVPASSTTGGGLYLVNCTTTVSDSSISSNVAEMAAEVAGSASAGGVFGSGGTLDFDNVTVDENRAGNEEASNSTGGGLWMNDVTLTATDSSISGNVAEAGGAESSSIAGGIFMSGGSVEMTGSSLSTNAARGGDSATAGALFVSEAFGASVSITLDECTVGGNVAGDAEALSAMGGAFSVSAVFNAAVTVLMRNCLVSNNRALSNGFSIGGVARLSASFDSSRAELIAVNSTFSGNDATGGSVEASAQGGVIDADATFDSARAAAEFYNSTIADNQVAAEFTSGAAFFVDGSFDSTRAEIVLSHSIVSDNIGADQCGADTFQGGLGVVTSAGYNVLGSDFGCTVGGDATGNQADTDPLLAALADNGGPTMTHAIDSSSPAHNAGNPGGCADNDDVALTRDQRGMTRPVGVCDVGAYEVQ